MNPTTAKPLNAVFTILALSLGLAAPALQAETKSSNKIDWAGDLAVLRRELPAKHPNLFFQTDRATFEAELETIAKAAPQLSNEEIGLRLQELMVKMGDDHSNAGWIPLMEKKAVLSFLLNWFSDGWRIMSTSRSHRELLGQKLTAVNGVPMDEVEARLARLISPHPQVVKTTLPGMILLPAALRHCGLLTDDTLTLTTQNDTGASIETAFSIKKEATSMKPDMVDFPLAKQPFAYQIQRTIVWSKAMAKSRVYYVQYNRCEGREVALRLGASREAAAKLPSLEELLSAEVTKLSAALAKGEVDRFILDLRFNAGGASDFGTRFAEKIAALPGMKTPGNVFVIIGRRTFSSAIINAGDFKRELGAILVGETTSGTPNHYGDTRTLTLPSSQLAITYSTKYFGQPGAPLEPMRPDLPAEISFAQFSRANDPSLTAILKLIEDNKTTTKPVAPKED